MYLIDMTLRNHIIQTNFETVVEMMTLLNRIGYDYIDLGFIVHRQSPSQQDKKSIQAAGETLTQSKWGLTCCLDDDTYMHAIHEWIQFAQCWSLGFVQILLDQANLIDLCLELIQWCTNQGLVVFCLIKRTNDHLPWIALKCLEMNAIVGVEDETMLPSELAVMDQIKEVMPDARLYFKSCNQLGLATANTMCALESGIEIIVTTLVQAFHIQFLCICYRLGYFVDHQQLDECKQFIQRFYPETGSTLDDLIQHIGALPRLYNVPLRQ